MSIQEVIEVLICSVVAVFGVAARELRYKDIKHLEMAKLISSMIVAVFGAIIVYFVTSMTSTPVQMGYIIAGFIGWGGPRVLDKIFEKQSGIKSDDGKRNKKKSESNDDNIDQINNKSKKHLWKRLNRRW